MAFLRSISTVNASPTIRGERVMLRAPIPSDHPQWGKLREDSRAFLAPWEPIWPADDLTKMSFRRRIKRYQREIRNGTGYPFFIFSPETIARRNLSAPVNPKLLAVYDRLAARSTS